MMGNRLTQPANLPDLDALTMRALAARLDARAEHYRKQCHCAIHAALIAQCELDATDLRTWAFDARGGELS